MVDSDFLMAENAGGDLPSQTRILRSANDVYNDNPVLPLPLSLVAEQARVSRALIYSHFPDQYELVRKLIESHLGIVHPQILEATRQGGVFLQTSQAVGSLLYDHFLRHGLILANATQDDFLQDRLPPAFKAVLASRLKVLAQLACQEFGFSRRQALAALILLAVIPEQAARLVRNGQIAEATGRKVLAARIKLSVETFRKD